MSDSEVKRHWRPDAEGAEESSTSKSYALSGKIMLTSIIILFVVVVFLVLLHLYARWYLLRLHRHNNTTRRRNRRNRSSRIIFHVDNNQLSPPTGGLQSSVLNSLPLFVYSSKNDENEENSPECAVCLAEFEDGEKGRLLPKCKHSFHTECIDMWFFSHSTCPLCRSPVEPVEIEPELKVIGEHGSSSEVTQATSLADRRKGIDVRIDVPSQNELVSETELPSQAFKSPGSRLMSFKKIINMSRKSPAVSPSSGVGPSSLHMATESDLESAMQESENESTRSETVIFNENYGKGQLGNGKQVD